MATAIKITDLVKVYGRLPVVKGIDLEIAPGSFTVFVGPSGCGKSTTLRMIAGLESISHGELLLDGQRVNDLPSRDRGVAMVFQSYALYPHKTVRENLAFSLKLEKLPATEIDHRIDQAVDVLQLEDYLDRKPSALSGGQRQRVAMGRALVREPKVFLFDEPLSNLDAKLRNQMRVEIKRLQRQLGVTTVYVTHDQIEAMTMADTIVVMRDGLVEQTGTPIEVFENPVNQFVASFIGTPQMNFVDVTISDGRATSADLGLSFSLPADRFDLGALNGKRAVMGARPEHIVPVGHGANLPADTQFEAEIEFSEMLGNETLLFCTVGEVKFVARMQNPRLIEPGEVMTFGVDVPRLNLFHHGTGDTLRRPLHR
jgi:multiple sugar transport system ATP-binding protein